MYLQFRGPLGGRSRGRPAPSNQACNSARFGEPRQELHGPPRGRPTADVGDEGKVLTGHATASQPRKIILGAERILPEKVPKMIIRPHPKHAKDRGPTLPATLRWSLPAARCSVHNLDLGLPDDHDFQSQTQDNGEIAARIFATHFGHLSIVAAWLSALFFAGGRFSNYEMWLVDPVRVKPAAQIVYGSKVLLQDTVNGETGAGSSAIRITTGIFSTWRAAGITCEHELFVTSIALLSLSAVFILAGWYHNHVAVPVRPGSMMSMRS